MFELCGGLYEQYISSWCSGTLDATKDFPHAFNNAVAQIKYSYAKIPFHFQFGEKSLP